MFNPGDSLKASKQVCRSLTQVYTDTATCHVKLIHGCCAAGSPLEEKIKRSNLRRMGHVVVGGAERRVQGSPGRPTEPYSNTR